MGLLSQHLRQQRMAKVLAHLRGDLLDVGCGHGALREAAGDRISSYAGIEISEKAAEQARARNPGCDVWACNLDDGLPEIDARFDTIAMLAIIEHLFNLKLVFGGLSVLLRPGGQIVLTTPTVIGNDVVHSLGARVGLFAKAAQDDHIVIFNRSRFRVLASEVGLELSEHRLFQMGCNQLAVLTRPAMYPGADRSLAKAPT